MAYANLTPNLQDMFNQINDRLRKLESGPNSAAYDASNASTQATSAAAGAAAAQAIAATAIQKDSYNTFNASNQLTAINGNGITVYSGSSPSTGARVVLNSAGLAGVNGSGTTTFAIDASTGNVSMTGALVSGGSISGASITIGGGNFAVTSGGALTSISGSIGGWNISSSALYTGTVSSPNQYLNASGGALLTGTVSVGALGVNTNSTIGGNETVAGYFYNTGYATTTSSANAYINSSTGLLARSSSSLRYKLNVEPQVIPVQSILQLQPKSFIDKASADAQDGKTDGLPRILGLIAEEIAQIPVLADLLMNKNEQGEPDSVNYDRVAVALLPLLQDHEARLAKLEGK
jgi:hypothetical protein